MVGFNQSDQLRPVGGEEGDDECNSVCGCRVRLDTCVPKLEVGRSHVRQPAVLQFEPAPRRELNRPGTHSSERPFDGLDGI
jgi:hypothetical protein